MSYSFFVFLFLVAHFMWLVFFLYVLCYCVACCLFVSCCSRFSCYILHSIRSFFALQKNISCFTFLLIAFNPSTFFPLNVLKFVTVNFELESQNTEEELACSEKYMFMTTHILTMKWLSRAHSSNALSSVFWHAITMHAIQCKTQRVGLLVRICAWQPLSLQVLSRIAFVAHSYWVKTNQHMKWTNCMRKDSHREEERWFFL